MLTAKRPKLPIRRDMRAALGNRTPDLRIASGSIGRRGTLADIAGTVASHLGLPVKPGETSWL